MPSIARPARRHRHGWTPERRARQAEAIRNWKPWTRSTGPRTEAGKASARYNGYKDGMSSQAMRRLRQTMKKQRAFLLRFEEQAKKHFKERQRQLNALRGRQRRKKQLRQAVAMQNAKNFRFSSDRTIGSGKSPRT